MSKPPTSFAQTFLALVHPTYGAGAIILHNDEPLQQTNENLGD